MLPFSDKGLSIVRSNRERSPCVPPWVVLFVALFAALLAACSNDEDVPELERRAQGINKEVMCPVCPGESIDQSQNPLAVQMRAIVVDKLGQDWTADEIKSFFVERYGPSVLLDPPRSGSTLLAWLVPPLGVAAAIALLVLALRLMRRPREGVPPEAGELSAPDRAAYFSRIEAAVEYGENGESDGRVADSEAERAT